MENSKQEMTLVGFYHFSAKDKSKIYYVVQCLYNEDDRVRGNLKGTMINVFVDDDTYKKVAELEIGTLLNIEVNPSLSTGKIYYKVVI